MEKRLARALLRLRYGLALKAADSIVRQLKCDGKLKIAAKTGGILLPDGKEDRCVLRSMDIALSFAGQWNAPEILPRQRDDLLYACFPDCCIRRGLYVLEGEEQEKSTLVDDAQDTAPEQSVYVMLLDSASRIVQHCYSNCHWALWF